MKATAIALAAALAFPALAQREPSPTSWRWLLDIGAVVGGIKGGIDLWEWASNKWNPPVSAFYCEPAQCSFGAPGSQLSDVGFAAATAFALSLGKQWHPGDLITICNGFECIDLEWTGGMFIAKGPIRKDPRAGYANKARNSSGGGGEGNARSGYAPSSRTWAPNVVYNPQRTGSVTVIFGGGIGGGSSSGTFPLSFETE